MDRAHAAIVQTDETVVHVVGKLTESAFAFVGSASQALGDNGIPQTVILANDAPHPALLAKFHPSVRLELAPPSAGPMKQFRHAVKLLCHEANTRSVAAIHLHGLLASLIAIYAVWFCGLSPRLFLLPHGSRWLWLVRGASSLLMRLRHPFRRGDSADGAVAHMPTGRPKALPPPAQPIRLIEHPIAAHFFAWDRQESRRPLIVAGTSADDPLGAAQFAQMAVLLGEESMALSFNWVGRVDAESRARLKAASVGLFDEEDAHGRAARLAGAWIYVAYAGAPVFPVLLAEAMALGIPCVAWDSPQNRNVVRHGETGLLCSSQSQLLASIAQLIDSPELRRNMGRNAQEEATRRFHPAKVRDVLDAVA